MLPGVNDRWFGDADAETRGVCSGVNGCLFQELVRAAGHCDANVADIFRYGSRLVCIHGQVGLCVCVGDVV